MSRGKRPPKKNARRREAEDRRRLFAAAYLRNGANGTAAAREAGYKGTDASIRVTASRLLTNANVRALLDERVEAAVDSIGGGMSDGEILERLTAQARSELTPFIQFITPELAQLAIEGCGSDEQRARNALRLIEGRGFYLDIEGALKKGHGPALQELTMGQDAMGFPEVKIKVRDPLGALTTLAKIKGLLREKPPAPPQSPVMLGVVLAELPTDVLLSMRQAMRAAQEKAKAIDIEARRV